MRAKGANRVGRARIDVEVANNDDLALMYRGMLQPDQVRRETIPGVVDSGAAMLVLPQAVVKRLGLRLGNQVLVRYADGQRGRRREAKGATIKLLGTRRHLYGRHRTETSGCPHRRDCPGSPRFSCGLQSPTCRASRSSWRRLRNRVNRRYGPPFGNGRTS
jgi:hypothetical protein